MSNLLLYYDILGFKKLLKTKSQEVLAEIIKSAVEQATAAISPNGPHLEVLRYADTVLLWSPVDGRDHRRHMLLWAAGCNAFLNLMGQGIPIRAAVVYRQFAPSSTARHIDDLTAEPALQEAHEYAEGYMSRAGLMGIVVAPSLSRLWSDEMLAPLVARGTISKRETSGEFYLNPFVSLTSRFGTWIENCARYTDAGRRQRENDEQAVRALAFLLRTRAQLARISDCDPRIRVKYDKTLEFVKAYIGQARFEEACGRARMIETGSDSNA